MLVTIAACGKTMAPPEAPHVPTENPASDLIDEDVDPCAETYARREAFLKEHEDDVHEGPGAEDHNYPPDCYLLSVSESADLPLHWSNNVGWCQVKDEIYGPKECALRFQDGQQSALIEVSAEEANAEISASISASDIFPGGDLEAIVRFHHYKTERVSVCRTSPTLDCTPLFLVADETWRARETLRDGVLVLEQGVGDPPAEVLGAHPLVFKGQGARGRGPLAAQPR